MIPKYILDGAIFHKSWFIFDQILVWGWIIELTALEVYWLFWVIWEPFATYPFDLLVYKCQR